MLVPGDRIFLVHEGLHTNIFNWRKDCPLSKLSPSELQDADDVEPVWTQEDEDDTLGPVLEKSMAYPLIISNVIHLVVPTSHEVFGVTIPLDDYDGDSIKTESLFKAEFDGTEGSKLFGHHHAVGTRDLGTTIFAAHYPWQLADSESFDGQAANSTALFTELTLPEGVLRKRLGPFRVLYDLFSRRVIVVNDKDVSQFVTLQNMCLDQRLR